MPETKITNEQLATEVMGLSLSSNTPHDPRLRWENNNGILQYYQCDLPRFLTDHNAAMLVVEKMREKGFEVDLITKCGHQGWIAKFWKYTPETPDVWELHKSLCVAICEAALKAVRV